MLQLGVLTRMKYHCRQICFVLPLLLEGCVADMFGARAVSYNQEAATNKDRTLLTNIIRASLGRPLQFTDLTTVSGTASQSLSLAGLFPFAVHRPPTVGQQSTFSPSISLSGGPTFSVANLSTKEFYSGILNSIPKGIIADYLAEGYPAEILLPLVISDITDKKRNLRIHNDVTYFDIFYSVLNGFIAIGLSAEPLNVPVPEGPALSEEDAKDAKLLASLASGAAAGNTTLDLKRYKVVKPTDPDNKDPNLLISEYNTLRRHGASVYFRLEKKGTNYGFCLDPVTLYKNLREAQKTLPVRIYLSYEYDKNGKLEPVAGTEYVIDKQDLCGANFQPNREVGGELATGQGRLKDLEFSTRSVAGVISFLGEIVRLKKPPRVFETPQGGKLVTLFEVSEESPWGPSMSATVDSNTYFITVDQSGADMSSRVIELLAELLALNNSAKDLPAPNVITVISP
jgi:hypothetical protein